MNEDESMVVDLAPRCCNNELMLVMLLDVAAIMRGVLISVFQRYNGLVEKVFLVKIG